jgi:AcrR family transcriptional regulator
MPGLPLAVHDRLLHAARERFATAGYENATTAAIARDAGTSESQLVKHFGSKAGLLEAIFEAAWADLEIQVKQVIREQPTPLARLLAVGDLVPRAMEHDTRLRTLVLLEGRRIRKNSDVVSISAGFRRCLALVDDLVRQMSEQGNFVPGVHLEALRSAWIGAIEAMVRDQLLAEQMGYPATFNRKVMRRTSILVLSAFLTPRQQHVAHAIAASE